MKTNPPIITLVLTLAVLPVVAFARPVDPMAKHTEALDHAPVALEHARATADAADTMVRFNLVDGQPIR